MREVKQIRVSTSHSPADDESPRAGGNITDILGPDLGSHKPHWLYFPDLIIVCFLFRLKNCQLMRRSSYNQTLIRSNVSSLRLMVVESLGALQCLATSSTCLGSTAVRSILLSWWVAAPVNSYSDNKVVSDSLYQPSLTSQLIINRS